MCILSFQPPVQHANDGQGTSMADRDLPSEPKAERGSIAIDAEYCCDADRKLSETIERALVDGSYPIDSVAAICRQGTVYLSGVVNSWHHKQLAQECVRRVPGVEALTNEIEVVSGGQPQK